jgi:hypothetical protein
VAAVDEDALFGMATDCEAGAGSVQGLARPLGCGIRHRPELRAVYRNHVAAKSYALAIGIAYDAGPFAFGLIFGPNFLGGLLPLDGADRVLHILTAALLAFGA